VNNKLHYAPLSFKHVNLRYRTEEFNGGWIHLQPSLTTYSQSSTGNLQQILGLFQSEFVSGGLRMSTTFYAVDRRQPIGLLLEAEWLIIYRAVLSSVTSIARCVYARY
jgi:hypothetical protein